MTKASTVLREEKTLEVYLHQILQEAKEKQIQKRRLLGMVYIQ